MGTNEKDRNVDKIFVNYAKWASQNTHKVNTNVRTVAECCTRGKQQTKTDTDKHVLAYHVVFVVSQGCRQLGAFWSQNGQERAWYTCAFGAFNIICPVIACFAHNNYMLLIIRVCLNFSNVFLFQNKCNQPNWYVFGSVQPFLSRLSRVWANLGRYGLISAILGPISG